MILQLVKFEMRGLDEPRYVFLLDGEPSAAFTMEVLLGADSAMQVLRRDFGYREPITERGWIRHLDELMRSLVTLYVEGDSICIRDHEDADGRRLFGV